MLGLLLVAAAFIVSGGSVVASSSNVRGVIGAAVGAAGALVLFGSAARLSVVPTPLHPMWWAKVLFHPGNYVLLSAVYLLLGFAVKLAGFATEADLTSKLGCSSLGNGLAAWALLLLILHVAMARNLHVSYHTHLAEDETDTLSSEPLPHCSPKLDVDVLVVGCGPVGLLTAITLAKSGASVAVVELRAEPIADARFLGLNSATMEHLKQYLDADIFAELLRRGMPNGSQSGSMLCTGLLQADAKIIKSAVTPPRGVMMEVRSTYDF